jgi:hypothetical protein
MIEALCYTKGRKEEGRLEDVTKRRRRERPRRKAEKRERNIIQGRRVGKRRIMAYKKEQHQTDFALC